MGLALCTTFAFAQTNNYAKPQKKQIHEPVQTVDLKAMAMQSADYKASIFTKAAGDTQARAELNAGIGIPALTAQATTSRQAGISVFIVSQK